MPVAAVAVFSFLAAPTEQAARAAAAMVDLVVHRERLIQEAAAAVLLKTLLAVTALLV
jgi:hypothetical protein